MAFNPFEMINEGSLRCLILKSGVFRNLQSVRSSVFPLL